jgi:hypothetical protein
MHGGRMMGAPMICLLGKGERNNLQWDHMMIR